MYLPVGIFATKACSEPDAYPKLVVQNLYLPKSSKTWQICPHSNLSTVVLGMGRFFKGQPNWVALMLDPVVYVFLVSKCTLSGWWFQTFCFFHNIWDNPSHWLSYFSKWLKPPTSYNWNWVFSNWNWVLDGFGGTLCVWSSDSSYDTQGSLSGDTNQVGLNLQRSKQ